MQIGPFSEPMLIFIFTQLATGIAIVWRVERNMAILIERMKSYGDRLDLLEQRQRRGSRN